MLISDNVFRLRSNSVSADALISETLKVIAAEPHCLGFDIIIYYDNIFWFTQAPFVPSAHSDPGEYRYLLVCVFSRAPPIVNRCAGSVMLWNSAPSAW